MGKRSRGPSKSSQTICQHLPSKCSRNHVTPCKIYEPCGSSPQGDPLTFSAMNGASDLIIFPGSRHAEEEQGGGERSNSSSRKVISSWT
ncbi:hypothetical protein JRQ81_019371 [Phrynocephalus forsythii]|uniref:Uncharacterized protein n=1 Tax=Phrynocephalus forsythii TaxID=171643 RepID=A0A9Q0XP84_9SAUR|nr:hypothetical protein JRQ81_019371 [Phrynocephalus forsythii]